MQDIDLLCVHQVPPLVVEHAATFPPPSPARDAPCQLPQPDPTCVHRATAKQRYLSSSSTEHQPQQPTKQRRAASVDTPQPSFVRPQSLYLDKHQLQLVYGCLQRQSQPQAQMSFEGLLPCEVISCILRVQEADRRAAATLEDVGEHSNPGVQQQETTASAHITCRYRGGLGFELVPACASAVCQGPNQRLQGSPSGFEVTRLTTGPSKLWHRRELASGAEQRIMAFRELRREIQFKEEPLLQQDGMQCALQQLQQHARGPERLHDVTAGVWTLHAAIADRILDCEVQQLVSCMNAAISTFVDGLLEEEAARMARLMQPMWHD